MPMAVYWKHTKRPTKLLFDRIIVIIINGSELLWSFKE